MLLTAGVLSSLFLGDALTTDTDFTNEPEAKRAAGLLEQRLRGPNVDTEFVVVTAESTSDRTRVSLVRRQTCKPRSRPSAQTSSDTSGAT